MAIALKINTTTGKIHQFATADALDIDTISRRSGSGNMVIGSNVGTDEVRLGSATGTVRVMNDLAVDGSSTITVDETVTGDFSAEGDVDLGNNDGDTISLGGGTSDTVQLLANLTVGAGLVGIGSSVTDYLSQLWLQAVNDEGPDAAAYNLRANGTNCGAYAIGVDPALLANSSATDLMSALDDLDAAIATVGATDTVAIENGVTIAVGEVVAASTTADRVTQANCNADTNSQVLGIALTGGTGDAGGTVTCTIALDTTKVTISGASFTAGSSVFAPDGTGAPTGTAPSGAGDVIYPLGIAQNATQFLVSLGTPVVLSS